MTRSESNKRYREKHPEKIKEANRKWDQQNPGRRAASTRACRNKYKLQYLRRRFDKHVAVWADETWEMIYAKLQAGICESCLEPNKLHVDHDHRTLKFRGVICGNCNRSLGMMKDSLARISNLFSYLVGRS